MAIPDFQTIMLPLLQELSDGQEHSLRELIEKLSIAFKLSDDDLRAVLPSGQQRTFDNTEKRCQEPALRYLICSCS